MFVYILCDIGSNVVKVGITRGDVFKRVAQINQQQSRYVLSVFGAKSFDERSALQLEKELLKYLSTNYEGVPYYFGGSTECFIATDVDELCMFLWNAVDNYKLEIEHRSSVAKEYERVVDNLTISLSELAGISKISLTDYVVLSIIKKHGSLSQGQIANDINVSTKTVERCIKSLVKAGCIEVVKNRVQGGVYNNEYTIKEVSK